MRKQNKISQIQLIYKITNANDWLVVSENDITSQSNRRAIGEMSDLGDGAVVGGSKNPQIHTYIDTLVIKYLENKLNKWSEVTESLAGRGGVKALCPEELDKHIKRFGNPYPGKHTCDKSLTNIDFEGLKYLFHIYVYTRMYNVQSNI